MDQNLGVACSLVSQSMNLVSRSVRKTVDLTFANKVQKVIIGIFNDIL